MSNDRTSDLVLLKTITEDSIVKSLKSRYASDKIYTYIGTGQVLLAVNPFKNIPKLYNPSVLQSYQNRRPIENPPHIYAIAETAFKNLKNKHHPQCVLVSGESGAGKTESAKKLMEFITTSSTGGKDEFTQKIKDKILRSNVLLEAFGNAKTLRNDNSSRFGKLMEILFDYGGLIVGGRVTEYLLEKIRVTRPKQGERNFHIFYQLCEACSRGEYSELGLGAPDCYTYLLKSGCFKVPRINDLSEFHATEQSMDAVGFTEEEKNSLFKVCAAILNLGNLNFGSSSDEAEGSCISPECADSLGWSAFHLNMDESILAHNLTHRKIDVNGEIYEKPIHPEEAAEARDALAMSLYSVAFKDIVVKLNKSMAVGSSGESSRIGILDIYGFEIFDENSMEQLHINYTNEKLQQLFIELTLKAEQEEYGREGIKWENVDYFDNQPVVTLIESKRPPGILALLDEETVMPRATDATFATKCGRHIQSPSFVGMGTTHFRVTHYAGDVVYTIDGMLQKNKDQLNKNLVEMLSNCNSDYIKMLYPPPEKTHKKPPTASFQFKKQMGELMMNLKQCEAHYVRTIKPNDLKKGGVFTEAMVKNQVTYLGLKENVLVRRAGYAVRQDYQEFFMRYRLLSESTWPFGTGDAVQDCVTILRDVGISSGFEKGKTKIFIRDPGTLFMLEDCRDNKLNTIANKIQGCYRAWIAIKYFLELRRKADEIFGGKKRRSGSVHLNFHGDYIAIKESLSASVAMREDPKLEANYQLSDIVFADFVDKVNRKGIVQQRILVVSSKAFYFLTPPLEKTAVKTKNNLNCLLGLSMSTMADGYLVLHFSDHDFVIVSRRKAEIVMILKERYTALMEAELPLDFGDRIEYKTFGGGLFRKKALQMHNIVFREDGSLGNRSTDMKYENGSLNIGVSRDLCSGALVQLNDSYGGGGGGGGGQYVPKKKAQAAIGAFASGAGGTGSTKNVYGGGPPKFGGPPSNPYNNAQTNLEKVNAPPPFGGGGKVAMPPAFGGGGAMPPPTFGGGGGGNRPASIARAAPRAPPKKFQPPPPPKKQATVLFDYAAADAGELGITEGEIITITKEDDSGWWEGKNKNGQTGLFPGNYVSMN